MSEPQVHSLSHGEILDSSLLNVFVPVDPEVELSSLLAEGQGLEGKSEKTTLVPEALQRDALFLDEKVDVFLLLKCPFAEEETFQSFVSRINITLEAIAVGSDKADKPTQDGQQPVPLKDLLETINLDSGEDPLVAVGEDEADGDGPRPIYLLWKTNTHIARHRIRSVNPSLFFNATLSLSLATLPPQPDDADEYMESGVPETINLLAHLMSDASFRRNPPHLSAARLEKVTTTSLAAADSTKPLRNSDRHLLRLTPAASLRVRFSRVGASSSQAKVLASLDVEVSSQIHEMSLEDVDVALSEGDAQSMLPPNKLALPKPLKRGDILGLIYDLQPHSRHLTTPPPRDASIHTFTATLHAKVTDGAQRRTLETIWRSAVDLTSLTRFPLISLSASAAPLNDNTLRAAGLKTTQPALTLRDTDLTLKVSSPPKVDVGETLVWTLLVANRAHRPLRLAVIPLMAGGSTATTALSGTGMGALTTAAANAKAKAPAKGHKHKSTLSTSLFTQPTNNTLPPRPTSQSQPQPPSTSAPTPLSVREDEQPTLLPLTADMRMPSLAPGECAEAELHFLTLRPGVGSVEALRVVDLDAVGKAEEALQSSGDGRLAKGYPSPYTDVPRGMLPDVVIWDGEWRKSPLSRAQELRVVG